MHDLVAQAVAFANAHQASVHLQNFTSTSEERRPPVHMVALNYRKPIFGRSACDHADGCPDMARAQAGTSATNTVKAP